MQVGDIPTCISSSLRKHMHCTMKAVIPCSWGQHAFCWQPMTCHDVPTVGHAAACTQVACTVREMKLHHSCCWLCLLFWVQFSELLGAMQYDHMLPCCHQLTTMWLVLQA